MQKQRGGTIACKNLSIHNNEVIKVILMVDFIERYHRMMIRPSSGIISRIFVSFVEINPKGKRFTIN